MTTKPPDSSRSNIRSRRPKSLGPVTSLEEHVQSDWWQTIFNSTYLKTDADVIDDPALTQAEATIFIKALQLSPDQRILDLCCGQGRHALELARLGFRSVSGFDRSRYLINRARSTARTEALYAAFREGDARKLPYQANSFDRVYIAGNSFGYFASAQDDAKVLSEVRRILAPGGKLLLDLSDGGWVRSNFEPRSWEWISQKQYVCRERSLSGDGQIVTSREIVADIDKGVLVDQFYAARLYDRDAVTHLLESCGFSGVSFVGEYETKSQKNQDLGLMGQRLIVTADVRKAEFAVNGHHQVAAHANSNGHGHTNGVAHTNGNGHKNGAVHANGDASHTNGASAPQVAASTSSGSLEPRKMKVGVVQGDPTRQDLVKPGGNFDEDDMETIGLLRTALSRIPGYEFTYFDKHSSLLEDLAASKVDYVLNLCDEGYKNDARLELHIPAMLDILDVPYTGAGPQGLAHCYDKSLVRGVARELGVPVAPGVFVNPGGPAPATLPFAFPVIVKPNFGDSSYGITQKSVAKGAAELRESVATVRRLTGGNRPVIVERLLTGDDLSLGLMGNPGAFHELPITREDYSAVPDNMPKICGYEAKWDPESPYWNILSLPARLPERTRQAIVEHSKLMFLRLGCRDYARFDWRLDAEGNPHMLEVNPNPGWCWDGHLAKMCKLAGFSYPQMLGLILESAEQRLGLRQKEAGKVYPAVEGASTEMVALRSF